MNFKGIVKKAVNVLFAKRPIYTTANIQVLSSSEILKGRCALITGGTSGIGYAMAKAFLNAGACVIITGRSQERVDKTCEKLNNPKRVFGFEMDNSNVFSFEAIFQKMLVAVRTEGFKSIDILVNNAGVLGGYLPNADEPSYDSVMDTNLKGVFFLSQLIGKYYKENGIKGNILNIASSSSLRPANSAYMLSKWGVRGLTLGLAKSLSPYGITVNGIAPGPTATPMLLGKDSNNIHHDKLPLGRYIMPEEIANMAVFLVSDMGRSVIGDIVYMTGGAGNICIDDMHYSF